MDSGIGVCVCVELDWFVGKVFLVLGQLQRGRVLCPGLEINGRYSCILREARDG